MQGALPSVLATCNADGTPNITHISQVWYVDENHVALSFQFFNKTARNIQTNPAASIRTFDPHSFDRWAIEARFVREETAGDTFENMEMQLEAIASMTGMEGIFNLKAAHIYEVLSVLRIPVVG
jgi:hypothetical protein